MSEQLQNEIEEMKSRVIDYEYILKENEELKKKIEELKKDPKTSFKQCILRYKTDENGSTYGERCLWGKTDMRELIKESEKLHAENEEWLRQVEAGELVSGDSVICSYDDANSFIFGRLKDICREEDLPHPEFCAGKIATELQSALVLKGENEKLKKENEKLKANFFEYRNKQKKARKERKARAETLNFGDGTHSFYWAAGNGDVVFWKVPEKLMELEDEDGECRVQSAMESFGEEWGTLSSHSIKTMTLAILEENE